MIDERNRWLSLAAPVALCVACGARSALPDGDASIADVTSTALVRLNCPTAPTDERLPTLRPGAAGLIDGEDFAEGSVVRWHWSVLNDDCDALLPNVGYSASGVEEPVLVFTPARPAPYRLRLEVMDESGHVAACTFEAAVQGQGMRVELCWDTSTSADLDLYLHTPYNSNAWYLSESASLDSGLTSDTCNPTNCPAELRLSQSRVNWGYADSAEEQCRQGPDADAFGELRRCPNPRSGIDNNQSLASGTSELIQLDNPNDQERFRVMIQNFDNLPAEPRVFVYCGGKVAGTFGPPATPRQFVADEPGTFGVMWRATDITAHVDHTGSVTCTTESLTNPTGSGAYVTVDDPSY